tara:strand:- start:8960 stop:9334 length:375 start_codon:yes stop_codon:yes gene_type:complete
MNSQRENNMYNKDNIFAKILRNEIPCDKVYEDDISLFFNDINPQAKIHVLGIPKVQCVDYFDFIDNSNEQTITSFFKTVNNVIDKLNIKSDGFRLITNSGINGGQEVPHFHVHILAGEKIGKLR